MKTTSTLALALVSSLTVGGSAMAASHHARSHAFQGPRYDAYDAWDQAPNDGYNGAYAAVPFNREGDGQNLYRLPGRSDVDASEPGFNPALDRAKGSL